MRTIRTKVYKFNELSKQAQEKAIDKFYYINVDDDDWHEFTTDEQVEQLINKGFQDAKIMFSGFSSQGDGACFTCSNIDFSKFLDGKYKELDIQANITHSWRYYFSTSTTVNLDAGDISDDLYNEIDQAIKDERETLGDEIYRTLEKEYEYLTSRESIIEAIEANEYEFTETGKLF